jgi:hypothetical protein
MNEDLRDTRSIRDIALWALLLLLGLWGGWLIARSSFPVGGRRFFSLFDDAMISMTYARNLIEGYGLNWARQGAPVEGFTHPLWLALMIPVNALPIALRYRALLVQLSSLVLLGATVVAVRRLMLDHFAERTGRWLPAAVLTAFYYPLAYWSLMGMECALQALLAVAAVHLALWIEKGRDRHLALWLVCAAAYLTRMDMLILVAVVQAWVVLRGGLRTPEARRKWLVGLAVFAAAVLGYELFRWLYFHDVLPNTYYLKLTGIPLRVRLIRGLTCLSVFLRDHLALLFLTGIGTAPLLRRNPRLALPAAIFALQMAYSVWVGGDAWDLDTPIAANRYLAFAMPMVFVLLGAVLDELLARRGRESLAGDYVATAVTVAGLLLANGLVGGPDTEASWRRMLGVDRPPLVDRAEEVVGQLEAFRKAVDSHAVVATAWAGIPAYFTDYRMIDILGFSDRRVARLPSQLAIDEDHIDLYTPGHDKWNLHVLLDEERPDAFFQVWGPRLLGGRVADTMRAHGYRRLGGFWVRGDSPWIRGSAAPPQALPPGEAGGASGGDRPHRRHPHPRRGNPALPSTTPPRS